MIVKVYIKRHMFHLPMKEPELVELVEKALNKENINKENFHKTFPLTKIEENDNIIVERQNTNIFLLNLLLWVLNHNNKEITEREYYNEELMVSKLEEETQLELKGLPFDAVEIEVDKYLNPPPVQTETEVESEPETGSQAETETREEAQGFSYLENVTFSVDWLKGAQQELDQKGRK